MGRSSCKEILRLKKIPIQYNFLDIQYKVLNTLILIKQFVFWLNEIKLNVIFICSFYIMIVNYSSPNK